MNEFYVHNSTINVNINRLILYMKKLELRVLVNSTAMERTNQNSNLDQSDS